MTPSSPRARIRALAVAVGVGVLVSTVGAAVPAAADGRIGVHYTKPSWATARTVVPHTGAVLGFEIALDLRDEAGAEAFATAVSTPGDPAYGRFLTPSAWIARFAPTKATFDTAVAAAKQAGLTFRSAPASREYFIGAGSVAALDRFFGTRVQGFSVGGRTRYAAVGAPTLPAALGDQVAAVSFDRAPVKPLVRPASRLPGGACSTYYGQHSVTIPKAYGVTRAATALCGMTPKQLRSLYDLDAKGARHYRGDGRTVAVIDAFAAPSMRRDLATFSKAAGLPAAKYREVLPSGATPADFLCTPAGWQVEQALDLEAVHSVAPGASLTYVGSGDCGFGFDLALSRVLDGGLASIVSNSYGGAGEDVLPATTLHQHIQAAGQGIGLYFASGDSGDDAGFTGAPAADFPATSPWVTAVGGTSSALDGRGRLALSTGWGDAVAPIVGTGSKARYEERPPGFFLAGAGGGVSTLFAAPAYQRGVVPASLAHGMRAESDVSAVASPFTGFAIGLRAGGAPYRRMTVGGTSLAAPVVAAEVALAEQQAGHRLGFLNPALYRLARRGGSAVRDVLPTTRPRLLTGTVYGTSVLVTPGRDSSLAVRRGYDEVTGVGELTRTSLTLLARG